MYHLKELAFQEWGKVFPDETPITNQVAKILFRKLNGGLYPRKCANKFVVAQASVITK